MTFDPPEGKAEGEPGNEARHGSMCSFGRHSFSLERSSVPTKDSCNPEKNKSRNEAAYIRKTEKKAVSSKKK